MWRFEKVTIAGKRYARAYDERGLFVSDRDVPQNVIDKATMFIDALFNLLDDHGVEIWEDGEAEFVIIDLELGDGTSVDYKCRGTDDEVIQISHNGYPVGRLIRNA